VLVVDDDAAVRRMICRILERAGHQCHQAADPVAARDLAQAHEFSLVTCDVNMPGGSGLDLVAELRQRHPDLAVVMVSGVDDPHTAATATKQGAFGYVIKPFESNEILISAENALRRRELELENRAHRDELERLVARRTSELLDTVDRLSHTERSLRASQEEAIRRLAFAAEFRDPDTGAHISRMARTCELLAERSGLGTPRAEMIRIASPMHDIGKIGVADRILRKPGPLTESEWDEIRKHPVMGAEILAGSDSELLQLGALISLTHHERWDGCGYPHGLVGESIPVEGRIVALADVFDALTSPRPYKPAFALDHALDIMRDERGRHFDPTYLDLFLTVVGDLVAERPPGADIPVESAVVSSGAFLSS
jgi:putative two-component system response regulator